MGMREICSYNSYWRGLECFENNRVKSSKDIGRDHFMERVTSRNGEYIFDVCDKLGFGNRDYELISID